jgi:hypothetical protein
MTTPTQIMIQEVRNLWRSLFPEEVVSPDDRQLTMWLLLHDAETVKRGIAHLAAKYRQLEGQMDSSYRVKFCSSVMNRMDQEEKAGRTNAALRRILPQEGGTC